MKAVVRCCPTSEGSGVRRSNQRLLGTVGAACVGEFMASILSKSRLAAVGQPFLRKSFAICLVVRHAHPMGGEDAELQAHYAQGKEWERLGDPTGVIEFERTKEILQRRLPAAPAVIADIGGGPGRYALWLAELGYTVEHRDLVRLHVEQLQRESGSMVHA